MNAFFKKFVELTPQDSLPQEFPATPFGLFRQIYKLDRWRWNALIFFTTLNPMIEPFVMWLIGGFVNQLSTGAIVPADILSHPSLWALLVIFALIFPLSESTENVIASLFVNPKLAQRTRFRAMSGLTHQSMDFFSNEMAGRVGAKLFDLGGSAADIMVMALTNTWYVFIFFITTVFAAFFGHWILAAIMGTWVIMVCGVIGYSLPLIAEKSDKLTHSRASAMGRCVDIIGNIGLTKLFSQPDKENIGFMALLNDHLKNIFDKNVTVTAITTVIYWLNGLFVALVLFASAWLWSNGAIQVGVLVALIPLVFRIRLMLDWVLQPAATISEHYGTVSNALELLRRPITINDKPNAQILPTAQGAIEIKNIGFTYASGRKIFDGLTLNIPAKQKVGLVGPSGAGKTTLVNLILRFYDVQTGEIKIDGFDVKDVTQDSLRAHIGMVTQEPSLLNRSIVENLLYARPDLSFDDVVEATKKAAAHDFILQLKDKDGRTGYDARVGERGVKLSGGQRQRIAIARLILKNAPIMLLDEATSALDSEIESVVQEQIYPLMENRTVIAIAHRLSTVMRMDRLIVMDQGKVVEDGTHHELLARDGLYARLWNRQSQGFLPKD
jgi:ATP-binding cassette, subfamily B, multidrug efflux pump